MHLRINNSHFQKDPDAMDVDVAQLEIHFTKLMKEEKIALRKCSISFRCYQDRHMSQDCSKKNESAEYRRPASTIARSGIHKVIEDLLQQILKQMKEHLVTNKAK